MPEKKKKKIICHFLCARCLSVESVSHFEDECLCLMKKIYCAGEPELMTNPNFICKITKKINIMMNVEYREKIDVKNQININENIEVKFAFN